MTKETIRFGAIVVSLAAMTTITACKIRTSEKGDDKRVSISTPVGGLNVRTDGVEGRDTGLPVYAGATIKPKKNEKDDNKANVNIDTPLFGLKVIAVTYETPDSPDKVLSWYREQMKPMGTLVECKPGQRSHGKDRGMEDLDKPVSCEKDVDVSMGDDAKTKNGVTVSDSSSTELKIGTNGNQRIVAVKPNGSGTEFSLVRLKLRKGSDDSI